MTLGEASGGLQKAFSLFSNSASTANSTSTTNSEISANNATTYLL